MDPLREAVDWARARLDEAGQALAPLAAQAADLALRRRVRLAVTGLARSGKTVFTSALVANLLAARARPGLLPFFALATDGRLLDARLAAPPARRAFPYAEAIAGLTATPPRWPPGTADISELRLEIDYRPAGALARRAAGRATLELEIVDYPGEWLIDLPLLGQDYEAWSQATLALCAEEPRRGLARAWREMLAAPALDPDGPDDPALRAEAAAAYAAFLRACRDSPHRLRFLQPGRFLEPGADLVGSPLLRFCPLPPDPSGLAQRPGSLRAAMAAAYDAYRDQVVARFYRDHFRRFDRQIVLVDALAALGSGPAGFADASRALSAILASFRYESGGLLQRLVGRRIDRVLFAATKADHVTTSQYHNLRHLLAAMCGEVADRAEEAGAGVSFQLLSSVKATANATQTIGGHRRAVVVGTPRGETREAAVFAAEIPAQLPGSDYWQDGGFAFVEFEPPRIADAAQAGIPSVHLDKVLDHLLGDRFA